jgi:hypothetical protein
MKRISLVAETVRLPCAGGAADRCEKLEQKRLAEVMLAGWRPICRARTCPFISFISTGSDSLVDYRFSQNLPAISTLVISLDLQALDLVICPGLLMRGPTVGAVEASPLQASKKRHDCRAGLGSCSDEADCAPVSHLNMHREICKRYCALRHRSFVP